MPDGSSDSPGCSENRRTPTLRGGVDGWWKLRGVHERPEDLCMFLQAFGVLEYCIMFICERFELKQLVLSHRWNTLPCSNTIWYLPD